MGKLVNVVIEKIVTNKGIKLVTKQEQQEMDTILAKGRCTYFVNGKQVWNYTYKIDKDGFEYIRILDKIDNHG